MAEPPAGFGQSPSPGIYTNGFIEETLLLLSPSSLLLEIMVLLNLGLSHVGFVDGLKVDDTGRLHHTGQYSVTRSLQRTIECQYNVATIPVYAISMGRPTTLWRYLRPRHSS